LAVVISLKQEASAGFQGGSHAVEQHPSLVGSGKLNKDSNYGVITAQRPLPIQQVDAVLEDRAGNQGFQGVHNRNSAVAG